MKDIQDDKFTDNLGDKLRGLREEPPAGMFDRIEQTLAAISASGATIESGTPEVVGKRIVPLWRRPLFAGVAAAAVVAVMLVASLLFRERMIGDEEILADVVPLEEGADDAVSVLLAVAPAPTESAVETTSSNVFSLPKSIHPAVPQPSGVVAPLTSEDEVIKVVDEKTAEETTVKEEPKKSSSKSAKVRTTRRRSSTRKSDAELEEYWRNIIEEQPRQRGASHPTQIALYASNVGFERGHEEVNNLAHSAMLVREHTNLSGGGSYLAPSLVEMHSKSELEHYMPVTVGVTLSYSLSDWLSINSGLLYTNLYSKSDSDGGLSRYGRRRTMDYLAVPLNVGVHFADFGQLSLYAKVGGSMEMCISARDKLYLDGAHYSTSKLDVPTLTFSMEASVGVDYALWGGLGLFGEVGCNYWKAPERYPENYRTIHPLGLSAKFGINFTFN